MYTGMNSATADIDKKRVSFDINNLK